MELQGPEQTNNLEKEQRGLALPDFKTCNKTAVIKSVVLAQGADRAPHGTERGARNNSHGCGRLLFNKVKRPFQWKGPSFRQAALEEVPVHTPRVKPRPSRVSRPR